MKTRQRNIVVRSIFHFVTLHLWFLPWLYGDKEISPCLKTRRYDLIDAFSGPVLFGDAVPDLFAFGLNPVKQLFFVQTKVFAVVEQRRHPTHVPAYDGIHDNSVMLAPCRLPRL